MKAMFAAAIAAVGLLAGHVAVAQFQKPEEAIRYRQSVFVVMDTHLSRIAAMAQGKVPFDAKAAADNAMIVSEMARLPFTAFGEGTDKGLPSRAKPEIWREVAKFQSATERMQGEIAKLDAAARNANLDAIKAAVGAVANSCKSCHDDFRSERFVGY